MVTLPTAPAKPMPPPYVAPPVTIAPRRPGETRFVFDFNKVKDKAKRKKLYDAMKAAAGNDPGFHFNDKDQTITTIYTYNQITEQNPVFKYHLNELSSSSLGDSQGGTPAQNAVDLFGTKALKNEEGLTKSAIVELTNRRLNDFSYDRFDAIFPANRVQTIDNALATTDGAGGAHHLLHDQNFDGFAIGEGHGDTASKKYLVDNMAALKAEGVNTLYIEQLRFREYQTMVDDWLRSSDPQLTGALAKFADASDGAHGLADKAPNNLRGVLEAAKANNMRVVGIDDSLAKGDAKGPQAAQERDARMNVYAEHVIRTDTPKRQGGKYVILDGQAHNNTHVGDPNGVPGMSQLLEIPAVTVGADGKLVPDHDNRSLR